MVFISNTTKTLIRWRRVFLNFDCISNVQFNFSKYLLNVSYASANFSLICESILQICHNFCKVSYILKYCQSNISNHLQIVNYVISDAIINGRNITHIKLLSFPIEKSEQKSLSSLNHHQVCFRRANFCILNWL